MAIFASRCQTMKQDSTIVELTGILVLIPEERIAVLFTLWEKGWLTQHLFTSL